LFDEKVLPVFTLWLKPLIDWGQDDNVKTVTTQMKTAEKMHFELKYIIPYISTVDKTNVLSFWYYSTVTIW